MDPIYAGAMLRRRREDRGWSRPALARVTHVSATTLRHLEAGRRSDTAKPTRPNRATLLSIARAFGPEEGRAILEEFGRPKLAADLWTGALALLETIEDGQKWTIMKIPANTSPTQGFRAIAETPR